MGNPAMNPAGVDGQISEIPARAGRNVSIGIGLGEIKDAPAVCCHMGESCGHIRSHGRQPSRRLRQFRCSPIPMTAQAYELLMNLCPWAPSMSGPMLVG